MTARIHFITLGCPKNEADTRRMAHRLEADGHAIVASEDAADVLVINTCAFIREAVEESVETVLEAARTWKAGAEGRRLVVAGCLPSRYEGVANALPEVDEFLPVADEDDVKRIAAIPGERPEGGRPGAASTAPSAYLKVSDGCSRGCTYCTIPAIRGPYRSRAMRDLVDEARALAGVGAREIVLVGQDTGAYGRDLGDTDLPALVRELAALEGVTWLRLMYVQPDAVSDELLGVMADRAEVCAYLDIPFQHASRDVLRGMGRRGDAQAHLALLARVRDAVPDAVLRTSLIAGFPGETERDLEELEGFLEAARLDYAGVFAFSPEEGTKAAGLPGALPHRERVARASRIGELATEIGVAKVEERIGRSVEVLVEAPDEDGRPKGRWRGQAPDVDGVVYLDRDCVAGSMVTAEIVDCLGFDLLGQVT